MKRPLRDTRPRWDDPNLPALRNKRDGSVVELDKDKASYVSQWYMDNSFEPDYKHDPTYNLRRKK